MAISKSLRYQVLRRDNHTCQYCGGTPPEVRLVVDHVVPVALGGDDSPSNLLTSCGDCNAGKSATPADAAVVKGVGERQREWAEALRQVQSESEEKRAERDKRAQQFYCLWTSWSNPDEEPLPLPDDWPNAVEVWVSRGLTMHDFEELIDIAMRKQGLRNVRVFRYFAGCCWRRLDDIAARASLLMQQRRETEQGDGA